jgi:hypothetical protein
MCCLRREHARIYSELFSTLCSESPSLHTIRALAAEIPVHHQTHSQPIVFLQSVHAHILFELCTLPPLVFSKLFNVREARRGRLELLILTVRCFTKQLLS